MNLFNQRFSNHVLPNGKEIDVSRLILVCHYSKTIRFEKVDINNITVKDSPLKQSSLDYLRGIANLAGFVNQKPIVITDDYFCLDGRHRLTVCKENGIDKISCIIVPKDDINRFIYNPNY